MYNPYQQGAYPNQGYQQYGQGYPAQPQATGFYPAAQNQGFPQPPQPGLFQGQQTGYQQQFQPQQSQQTPPGFQQPQQTGFGFQNLAPGGPQASGYAAQQQAPLAAQKTGFSAALPGVQQNQDVHIPNIRLSFISAADQVKFEHLFRTAVAAGENAVSGDAARDILLRSGLSPVTLAEVWALADTNKLGSLLFPEFALALHLCNSALQGERLPAALPEKWANEVQSFVDAISFSVPEDPSKVLANTPFSSFAPLASDWLAQPAAPAQASFSQPAAGPHSMNALSSQRTGGGTLVPLQPQQTSGFVPASHPVQPQRTGPLAPQLTGFLQQPQLTAQRTGTIPPTSFQAQATGGFQAQATGGFQPQATGGLQPQTSFQNQQTGGFQPQQTGLQPQLTGFQPQQTGLQPQATGLPLQAQPTGRPGEWGFVHTPTGGIPGLSAMQQHFLPSAQLPSNNLQDAMGGSLKNNVTWAITKQEKLIYDGVFAAWDKFRKGYIDGDVAISIFGKSGLGRPDLETIWNLCDSNNRGKLNKDEFAVAMHLVYRRLNGLEIPLRLPPELVPPSSKLLQDSVESMKSSLKGGSAARKAPAQAKPPSSATRFKNDDDNVSYTSSSRHRSRNPTEKTTSSVKSSSSKDLTIEDLKKLIREKKILLDAADSEDQHNSIAARRVEESNARDIERTKAQLRDVQSQLNALSAGGTEAEKADLFTTLNHLTKDTVPNLISRIFQVTSEISKAKSELAKASLKKKYPDWNPENSDSGIEATGPNGEITESDRRKFKSKQLLRQRMAALTGKPYSEDSNSDAEMQWKQMSETADKEREAQSAMIKDIETSIKDLEEGAAIHLEVSEKSSLGSNKWENGEGVSSTLRNFINELKNFSKPQPKALQNNANESYQNSRILTPAQQAPKENKPAYSTPEERAAYIKLQAEKRMNDRLAKLGISRNRNSSFGAQNNTSQPSISQKPEEKLPEQAAPTQEAKKVVSLTNVGASEQAPGNPSEKKSMKSEDIESSDDEADEEYEALLRQKKEMERKRREKELKKQEKEARLAKLKKEMELMERQDDDWSDNDIESQPKVPLYNPSNTSDVPSNATSIEKPETKLDIEPDAKSEPADQIPKPSNNEAKQPHKSNPFSRFGTNTGSSSTSNAPSSSTNPFFKPNQVDKPLDQKKLDAQRASQRGLDNDDWSDDDQKSSDEEGPNRAGAAKLASLLFGGMPQPVSKDPTGSYQTKATSQTLDPVNQHETEQEEKSLEPESDDEFATPSPESAPAQSPNISPAQELPAAIPSQAPPIPTDVPPIPSTAPPVPTEAPPRMEVAPSPNHGGPESSVPPLNVPPPPPPPGPPPPGPPPPPSFVPPSGGESLPKPSGPLDIGALLGQIQGGKSLKKVSENEKHIADAAVVGRVL
ncbi:hypothetical protein METBIDRAFT_63645 [Metschnikowia bicuspidata var. bicuspidata NRRL YB-4993]|uniref:Actin cytoskeleton-regulatory complex protein PAN1 n=1 Tax=Metschnikowia bicuspidata var. bicuspidata NRRL YB-4993 TaxID=869754 RepID=A0A1A0HH93_9ASCO|nr:hypothetical protein METBIDRAFT_63645 [Metschnikowia bicuspidata var. bicuspidata NRRL YB-4993]OBA23247.1 hypothetical protein METBIDRAFT_63645 [Metschnikowia bicuspidata var. bicuspidata NRRL YB-4993]